MGSLTPNAVYVYESVDGIVYARESGAPVNSRVEIGRTIDRQRLDEEKSRINLWKEIFKEAETNLALRKAIDQCIMIYYLNKEK